MIIFWRSIDYLTYERLHSVPISSLLQIERTYGAKVALRVAAVPLQSDSVQNSGQIAEININPEQKQCAMNERMVSALLHLARNRTGPIRSSSRLLEETAAGLSAISTDFLSVRSGLYTHLACQDIWLYQVPVMPPLFLWSPSNLWEIPRGKAPKREWF